MTVVIDDILAQSGDPKRARIDLKRFEEACVRTLGRPPDWEAVPHLARLFGNSRVLADRLIAHPGWLAEIAASPYRAKRKFREEIGSELGSLLAEATTEDAFGAVLRCFKYRELIRLVAQDLAGTIDPKAMLAEWSDIADALIVATFDRGMVALSERLGFPRCPDRTLCAGVIIALGKLGGRELNVSSDVDLLVLYATDEGSAVSPVGHAITTHEFFVRLASDLTRRLSASTADGFVFRVDHELRPEGVQGALANAVDAALRYYESFGSDWERHALIRARPIAGDLLLGERFLAELTPFVYRRSIAIDDIAHMREMKERMEEKAAGGDHFDIKHGHGGIREAEFLVQALQVLHGGAHPAVRTQSTFEAIAALLEERLIHPFGAGLLRESYAFLRRAENMIQAEDDLQTHRLPAGPAAMTALARRLGFCDDDPAAELGSELARHTRAVAGLFRALFEADYERLELEEAIEENLSRATDEEEEADSLAWFRRNESQRLAADDLRGHIALPELLRRLTLIAEVVVACAWRMARARLVERYGEPRLADGSSAEFAAVGMGRFGSRELDYGSDLDLIFFYSGDGRTDGSRSIANVEFFTKLAQRIISLVSLSTRYGRAYRVDSELRPSGGQGTLITTLASFFAYHAQSAEVWERLALLRARPIAGGNLFLKEVRLALEAEAFAQAPPPDAIVCTEIDRLRTRSLDERSAEKPDCRDIKIGPGGLAELEAVIQRAHLRLAHRFGVLRRQNTFEVIDAMESKGIVDGEETASWRDHLFFFRKLLARMRFISASPIDALDLRSPLAHAVASELGFADVAALTQEIDRHRDEVHSIYAAAIKETPAHGHGR